MDPHLADKIRLIARGYATSAKRPSLLPTRKRYCLTCQRPFIITPSTQVFCLGKTGKSRKCRKAYFAQATTCFYCNRLPAKGHLQRDHIVGVRHLDEHPDTVRSETFRMARECVPCCPSCNTRLSKLGDPPYILTRLSLIEERLGTSLHPHAGDPQITAHIIAMRHRLRYV